MLTITKPSIIICFLSTAILNFAQVPEDKSPIQSPPGNSIRKTQIPKNMVLIPSGTFLMGSSGGMHTMRRELPRHKVQVNSFYMDEHEVTNEEFAKFVSETGYITTAEKPVDWELLKKTLPGGTPAPTDDQLKPGSLVFKSPKEVGNISDYTQWWEWVPGADWRHPFGPDSDIVGKEKFPVVHISFKDAQAYANWCGKRLPTEAEWEWAARGGLVDKMYSWGEEDVSTGLPKANIWEGNFPISNNKYDGFEGLAPVKSFAPNGYGLYDMAGNVWEICSDYYDELYYRTLADKVSINPTGPSKSYDPAEPLNKTKHSLRGGSFMCNEKTCAGYRVSARMSTSEDSSMINVGFRLVKDIK